MIHTETILIPIAVLACLAALTFWGAMAVHCYKNQLLSRENRVLWLVAIVCGKLLGAGAYYFFRFRQRPSTP